MPNFSKRKVIIKYFSWDNIIFTLILFSITFYLLFQTLVLHTVSPQVAVTTTSMVPTYQGFNLTQEGDFPTQYYDILRGDVLIVQNIPPHVGDVIVFQVDAHSTPIVHRIIAEKMEGGTNYFATKGDHNSYSDAGDQRGLKFGWIKQSDILGVVVFSIHYLGWFTLQLQSLFVQTSLIVLMIVIFVYSLYDSFRSKKKNFNDSIVKRKKNIYIKFKRLKVKINRPRVFSFLVVLLLVSTYIGIGYVDFKNNNNSVTWVKSTPDENNNIINLKNSIGATRTEVYSNLYFYNCLMLINSSGSLNFINKVEITPVFTSLNSTNPTYVWTIVYDYYGSKLIHTVLIFNIPQNISNVQLDTIIYFKIYTSGLLASNPITSSLKVEVII